MKENELIIYRNLKEDSLLRDMAWLMAHYDDDYYNREDRESLFFDCIHRILDKAAHHGFHGNLWHCFLANLLVNDENSYSLGCEIKGNLEGTLNEVALHDFQIMKEFIDYDFTKMGEMFGNEYLTYIAHFEGNYEKSRVYNGRIRDQICEVAVQIGKSTSAEEVKDIITSFYEHFGVGKFGLNKSFRISHPEGGEMEIKAIKNIDHVKLEDLVGYEIAKKKLIDNTEAFVQGRPANNCLLFGDAGTGKSSSIKGIINKYYDQGLRMIEVYKHQFQDLNDVIAQIKNRNYKFIIYMDDLSFEEFEIEYKYLKAIIEGGLEVKPDNVLIYATSNRRHLVREKFSDKEERRDDLHASDTVQEKLSLVARFGVSIFFCAPNKKEFQEIVKVLAKRNDISMDEEELLLEANKWELSHGGLSGRTAQQFIDYLAGKDCK
ncbi:MAG: ATP-binding protein [Clostridiales bacterium]|nr:ATP-binding protein [Clostridiales bacterium]